MRRHWAITALVAVAAFGTGFAVSSVDGNGETEGTDEESPRSSDEPSTAGGQPTAGEREPGDEPVTVSSVHVADLEEVEAHDPELGTRAGSPLDDLPEGMTALTHFGQRPDWSPDGQHLVFLDDSPLGHVWTVDVNSGETHNLTGELGDQRYSRAYYVSNGDLLLCGPTSGPEPTPERPEAGRFTGVMSILQAPFDEPPQSLGMPCWEGIAAARSSMRIAWNRSDIDYTDTDLVDRVVNGITEVWTGEIRFVDDRPVIVGARKVLDRDLFGAFAVFEVQAFRPPSEDELILTAYAYQAGEVIGLNTRTGELRNYSNSSAYEEAEGIDPDGSHVYVERDLEYGGIEPGALDIWRLDLEDSAWERITRFNRYAPFYASNPAVSPDGRQLAFQLSIDGDVEGEGDGILLLDLG